MDCSHRITQGSRVYFTNSRDCCSILEKLDFSRSPTMCGGTLKIRAISLIWNFLVSRNCACSGEMEMGVYFMPSSSTAILLLFAEPPKVCCQLSLTREGSLIVPGCSSTPEGAAPLAKNLLPYSSVAMARSMAFFAMAMGLYPTRPSKPSPGICSTSEGVKRDGIAVVLRKLVLRLLIGVIQLSVLVPADRHLVRHQRIERNDLALAVAYDLRIGVVPQQEVRHKRFPEHEGTHLRVRLVMQKLIQRMVDGFFLAAVLFVSVHMEWKARNSL